MEPSPGRSNQSAGADANSNNSAPAANEISSTWPQRAVGADEVQVQHFAWMRCAAFVEGTRV
jgi:hypothetical protein